LSGIPNLPSGSSRSAATLRLISATTLFDGIWFRLDVAPRKRGHSKNGRGDAPQIIVGLAVTRDGFPVRHWVFPGSTVE
jgi:hypothetical protein